MISKVAIVDLDGTLIDSTKRHEEVLKAAIENSSNLSRTYGIDSSRLNSFVKYKANGYNTKHFLINQCDMSEKDAQIVNDYWVSNIENTEFLTQDYFYNDALSFIQKLKGNSFDIYILTSRKNEEFISNYINASVIKDFIKELKVVNTKDATIFKMEYINSVTFDASVSVMIGDTEVDYDAAIGAGIKPYILNRGFRSKAFWDKRNIKSYDNLLQIIDEILDK